MAARSRLWPLLGGGLSLVTRLESRRLSPTVLLGAGAGLGLAGAGVWLSWSSPSPSPEAGPRGQRRLWSRSGGARGLSGRCSVYAAEQVKDKPKEDVKEGSASTRKLRFKQYASMEYEGDLYMTPRDFLFSVILEDHDNGGNFLTGKLQTKKLTKQDVEDIITTSMSMKASSSLFRDLGDNGLISYTEYLFLLCILTKPRTGFHIAFSMLDTDGNQQVEKKEFLVLKTIIGQRKETKPEARAAQQEGDTELKTMLLIHFFGKEGKLKLQFKDFYRFMEDLQTEVQEIEFKEFSRGMKTMRREEFAAWLLHFTEEENHKTYWENVRLRIPAGESISFEEFRAFCRFMNHLEDFAFTMNMFTKSNRPVGIADFKRAVKVVTGQELSDNVLDTVFKIFDLDGDGCLSHQEFLGAIMTRLHRGLKAPPQIGLNGYLKCVKNETIGGVHEAWKQTGRSPF